MHETWGPVLGNIAILVSLALIMKISRRAAIRDDKPSTKWQFKD
jgi:hypothetical protein